MKKSILDRKPIAILFSVGLSLGVGAPLKGEETSSSSISARFDCMNDFNLQKGANQACLNINSMRLTFHHDPSSAIKQTISLDPFASPAPLFATQPETLDLTRPSLADTDVPFIADYAFLWQFRPGLTLSLQKFNGTTILPSFSGLAFAGALEDNGWDQTALVATYRLPPLDGIQVRIALGNGEGENFRNTDIQQYGGLEIIAGLIPGLKLQLGISFDGNNIGSSTYTWLIKGEPSTVEFTPPSLGFSTQRWSAALFLDGLLPAIKGLKLSIGTQNTTRSDLDKNLTSLPPTLFTNPTKKIDPSMILAEDPTRANAITNSLMDLNFSYLILGEHFIGCDLSSRNIRTGSVSAFTITDNGPTNTLGETSYTCGAGIQPAEKFLVTLEYVVSTYDKLYQTFNFTGENGVKEKKRELIDARFSYNW